MSPYAMTAEVFFVLQAVVVASSRIFRCRRVRFIFIPPLAPGLPAAQAARREERFRPRQAPSLP